MSKPAARLGDMTAHGGTIILGFPTVLIGGQPAARLGDMHVCPMVTPGLPPIPHVGGPIVLGSTGVLIGGQPAARMGDMVTCVGPPDVIALGCPTVLIGEIAAGSSSGGGPGTPGGAGAAQAGASTALSDNTEATTREEHWIEFEFVDKAGLPISGTPYTFTDPDGKASEGVLHPDGSIRRDALSAGQGKVVLRSVSGAQWSKEEAEIDEEVTLSAKTEGFASGTPALFQIYRRDLRGPDVVVDNVETEVQADKVEASWAYHYEHDDETVGIVHEGTLAHYSAPAYYFIVIVGHRTARAGLLKYKDYIEIELKDTAGHPVADEAYLLYLSNGEVREGTLDQQGYKKEENLPPGKCFVRFPNLTDPMDEV